MDVVVGCAELRADSARWAEAATELEAAAQVTQGLTLADKFPPRLRELAALTIARYDEFQQALGDVLTGGGQTLNGLSGAVLGIADTYEREDAEGAHEVARADAAADGGDHTLARPGQDTNTMDRGMDANDPSRIGDDQHDLGKVGGN